MCSCSIWSLTGWDFPKRLKPIHCKAVMDGLMLAAARTIARCGEEAVPFNRNEFSRSL